MFHLCFIMVLYLLNGNDGRDGNYGKIGNDENYRKIGKSPIGLIRLIANSAFRLFGELDKLLILLFCKKKRIAKQFCLQSSPMKHYFSIIVLLFISEVTVWNPFLLFWYRGDAAGAA